MKGKKSQKDLSGIIGLIIQMKPNEELLESLFEGACHLYKLHFVSHNRKQFEVYFQIDIFAMGDNKLFQERQIVKSRRNTYTS
ncbi:unnamed protein product (macronuclear) [Paramecium tetraurelia]|uniref:Uncharacterized protein n=1 Tax=Paramecium tetraurelia TaxID=5888 RepID=A0D2X9_PARTE|nr:uncharacterized protein GSPATT00012881001 [Paramecium tetraurelia]CAK77396.1 unnamed protein product [Paramecium tetraurelia]|eukprot:XP_001444793.1 hypothetical protein (macronuclear) [Paramecium tetraurelia strain d4-2]